MGPEAEVLGWSPNPYHITAACPSVSSPMREIVSPWEELKRLQKEFIHKVLLDPSSSPGSGRSPEEGIGYQLQYCWASLVAQMVKNVPAMWETWVQALGWEDPWRRKWQSTPVLLPGKSHGQRSLVGYSLWGRKESDMTERLHFHFDCF